MANDSLGRVKRAGRRRASALTEFRASIRDAREGGHSLREIARAAGVTHAAVFKITRDTNGRNNMTAAQTAETDRSNERFVVVTGTVPSREIQVSTRTEAVELAHRTNGNWARVPRGE